MKLVRTYDGGWVNAEFVKNWRIEKGGDVYADEILVREFRHGAAACFYLSKLVAKLQDPNDTAPAPNVSIRKVQKGKKAIYEVYIDGVFIGDSLNREDAEEYKEIITAELAEIANEDIKVSVMPDSVDITRYFKGVK